MIRATMLTRRCLLGGTVATLAMPLVSGAQSSPKMLRVGVLAQGLPPAHFASTPFVQRLHDLGWVEGQNVRSTARYAQGQDDQLPVLAAELVREGADVLFAVSTPAAIAARHSDVDDPHHIRVRERSYREPSRD